MQRLPGYPPWFYAALMSLLAALLASGACLLPTMLDLRLELDMGWHPDGHLRLLGAGLHTLIAFIALGTIGALTTIHMRIGWRRRLNRISGVALVLLSAAMLLSAIGIFYAGDDSWSRGSSIVHTVAGLLACPLYAWHAIKGRRLRKLGMRLCNG